MTRVVAGANRLQSKTSRAAPGDDDDEMVMYSLSSPLTFLVR